MPLKNVNPTQTKAWQALQAHCDDWGATGLLDLFESHPNRGHEFSLYAEPEFLLDYSKQKVNAQTMSLLCDLARECGVPEGIEAMYNAELINGTEHRAVLHVALRMPQGRSLELEGADVVPEVHKVLAQMRFFCDAVRSGQWRGYSGKSITDIVNIGIGGSYLGPEVVCEALKPYATLKTHFVANVDGADIAQVLQKLNPETTLFLIASKTFTTQETMVNAQSAKTWFLENGGSAKTVAQHFAAMSTNYDKVVEFGIDPANMFPFWDWVGGRFSVWSAIGLSVALSVGFENFNEFLHGGHIMDEHFRTAPLERNMPVIMALLSIWNGNFWGAESECVLPYDQTLKRFPAFLQQLLMESNGKSVSRGGQPVSWQTGQIVWGEPGTNGQHAFYQLIHQGTRLIPADFLICAQSHYEVGQHHLILAANALAQSEALMRGQNEAETRRRLESEGIFGAELEALLPHRIFAGNKPSSTILMRKLTPTAVGMLLALYEHKTFVQGLIWDVYSFDQWGVELGKKLAGAILAQLKDGGADSEPPHDGSTTRLMHEFMEMRGNKPL